MLTIILRHDNVITVASKFKTKKADRTVNINLSLRDRLRAYCRRHGLIMTAFVSRLIEEAIKDKTS